MSTPRPSLLGDEKNAHAAGVELGTRGGKARGAKLTKKEKHDIAVLAAKARWNREKYIPRFFVYRADCESPLASFMVDNWAEAWIRELSLPRNNYRIVDISEPTSP